MDSLAVLPEVCGSCNLQGSGNNLGKSFCCFNRTVHKMLQIQPKYAAATFLETFPATQSVALRRELIPS